ncbi:phosphotransferase [Streptomyces sp. NPDC001380]|uniref:phosphotransferase n=1 Tax=Streptomyces sp. NPDC001380 TaxID=3364566 RepID=UPI0036826273
MDLPAPDPPAADPPPGARPRADAPHPSRADALLRSAGRALLPPADRDAVPQVLADRPDGTVLRFGATVLKAHAPGTGRAALEARLDAAAGPALRTVLLPPLPVPGSGRLLAEAGGLLVTAWPAGRPVAPDAPELAPWEQAGALAARLHAVPPPPGLPPMGGPAKVAAALRRLDAAAGAHPAGAAAVRAACATLPAWARGAAEPPAHPAPRLVHGDLHLGQLVRLPGAPPGDPHRGWRLIDVDDLGRGDPAWDLARPAAWYAAGLLPPGPWQRFLAAYRGAGGPALPDGPADPWTVLEVPARALVVQLAALALVRAAREGREPDEVERLVLDACARIAGTAPAPGQ